MRILLAILLLPLIDIASFVVVGPRLGVAGTLLMVVASILLGVGILRRNGLRAIQYLRATLVEGRQAMPETIDAALMALAGILFIMPGFASDLLAALLLFPPVRELAVRQTLKYLAEHAHVFVVKDGAPPRSTIIDAEFHEVDGPGK